MADDSQIVLYQPDESISLHVKIDEASNTVWLSLDQMAELFGRDRSVIGKHVRTIFNEGELQKESVWAKFAYTASDGKTYQVDYYNLDVIISVGYRVKSVQGTKFRIWATSVLRQYLLQGYSVNRHLIALQENMDKRMTHIEDVQAKQQQQLDFFIRTSTPPAEMVFFEGDLWYNEASVPNLCPDMAKRASRQYIRYVIQCRSNHGIGNGYRERRLSQSRSNLPPIPSVGRVRSGQIHRCCQ